MNVFTILTKRIEDDWRPKLNISQDTYLETTLLNIPRSSRLFYRSLILCFKYKNA